MRALCMLALGVAALAAAPAAEAGNWTCDSRTPNDHQLRLAGGIGEGEFDRFKQAFGACFPRSYAGQRTIDLYSGGGSVSEALAISQALIDAGSGARPILTRVSRGSYCISACTYIFVSGRFRDVAGGGSFEPHGFSSFSGTRIDRASEEVLAYDKSSGEEQPSIQTARLQLMAQWLEPLAEGDARFNWTVAWIRDFLKTADDVGISPAVARAFMKLNPAQRDFIQNFDAIIAAALPELERVAALEAFAPLLASSTRRADGERPKVDEKLYLSWVTGEVALAARGYLGTLKDSRKPVLSDDFVTQVLRRQRERADSVRRTVTSDLGPYLLSRSNEVDLPGLVTLMFSTSILYTRPLAREEMCDLNIINRDCAN